MRGVAARGGCRAAVGLGALLAVTVGPASGQAPPGGIEPTVFPGSEDPASWQAFTMEPLFQAAPTPSHRTLEFVAGILGAVTAGALAYRTAEALADDRAVKGDAGYSPAGNVAFVPGSLLGAATGAYAVRRSGGGQGSFGLALLGAAIPSTLLLLGLDEPYMPIIAVATVVPLQSLGARMGLDRR